MLLIVLRRLSWFSYFVWLCGFYYEVFHVESHLAPCSHDFFYPIVIISLGEGGKLAYIPCLFVCVEA